MLGAGWFGKPDLKALCGGEALPRDLATKLSRPSWSTLEYVWTDRDNDLVDDQPRHGSIGGHPDRPPIANTRVYVLERSGLFAPIGAFGELAIAGEGVARGYWNWPELTAEKFQ